MMMMKHILLLLVIILLSEYSDACHPTDQEALLEFKKGITFDSGLLETWVPTTDCCSAWEGVRCNLGRVIDIRRFGFNYFGPRPNTMAGTISSFLGNLSSLIALELNRLSDLEGPIPAELSKLTQLRLLSLPGNKLQGPIPEKLLNLKNLTIFNFTWNRLSGKIPPHKTDIPASAFEGNPDLCGAPLPPCKN